MGRPSLPTRCRRRSSGLVILGLVGLVLAVLPVRTQAQGVKPPGPVYVPTDVKVTTDPAGTNVVTETQPGKDLYLSFTLQPPPASLKTRRLRASAPPPRVKVRISEKKFGPGHGLLMRKNDQKLMPFDQNDVGVGQRYVVPLRVSRNLAQIYDSVTVHVTSQPGTPEQASSSAAPFRIQPVMLE